MEKEKNFQINRRNKHLLVSHAEGTEILHIGDEVVFANIAYIPDPKESNSSLPGNAVHSLVKATQLGNRAVEKSRQRQHAYNPGFTYLGKGSLRDTLHTIAESAYNIRFIAKVSGKISLVVSLDPDTFCAETPAVRQLLYELADSTTKPCYGQLVENSYLNMRVLCIDHGIGAQRRHIGLTEEGDIPALQAA